MLLSGDGPCIAKKREYMQRKNKPEAYSESTFSERGLHAQTESSHETDRLNFWSSEFNSIDDLDDNTENYTNFASLKGIVTADMRHQEERKRAKRDTVPSADEQAAEKGQSARTKNKEAASLPPLTIISRGRTLIISADLEHALELGKFLNNHGLSCTLCLPGSGENLSLARIGSFVLIKVDSLSITGSFGGFRATATTKSGKTNLAMLLGEERGFFDLVLDMQAMPSFVGKLLPTGYYAPGNDQALLDEALAELPEMRGRFTKPHFTEFLAKRCLHGRLADSDCHRCREVCPVNAIRTEERGIRIDPYLCQGCGGCALVCPADAIQMHHRQNQLPEMGRALLEQSMSTRESGNPVDLVLYDMNIGVDALGRGEGNRIFFGIEEAGMAGVEFFLVALAYGADRVTLICDRERPAGIRQALQHQAELGQLILQGLGFPDNRIRFLLHSSDSSDTGFDVEPVLAAAADWPKYTPATFDLEQDRRTLTQLAVHHLWETSGRKKSIIPLPADVPFGAVAVRNTDCSFCMSCVGTCPFDALTSADTVPRISLVESRCHQCGLCAAVCPEEAIVLHPRLLCNLHAADAPTVLHEEEPLQCIECGEPFAAPTMVKRMEQKLKGHWMYSSDRQVRRLKMCRTCRTRDVLSAGDYR